MESNSWRPVETVVSDIGPIGRIGPIRFGLGLLTADPYRFLAVTTCAANGKRKALPFA
jgi:hypothetical protein